PVLPPSARVPYTTLFRSALRCTLATLDVRQVAAYISGRIQIAGGVAGQVFTREAVMAVHAHSNGIPRVISVICDNALVSGFAARSEEHTSELQSRENLVC